jgi:hypothetical protein
VITGVIETLTSPVIGPILAPSCWMVANDLLDGARAGPTRAVGMSLAAAGVLATARNSRRRAITAALTASP